MGVGLHLTGTLRDDDVSQTPEDWLEHVASWLESHEEEPLMLCRVGTSADDEPVLFVQIHPCAEDVEFSVPEPNTCLVRAKTSTAGPGYHIFLCDLVRAFGQQFNIEWSETEEGDDTGYFFKGDNEAVRAEMLAWLSALSRVVVENCQDGDQDDETAVSIRMVSMPLDYSYPQATGILTPVGPRAAAWFEPLVDAPEQGTEFFPWWPEGVGAVFFLGRALCRLWQDMRWRAPVTEDEGELLMDIHLDLERAHYLDPNSPIPWREWREVLQFLNAHFGYAEFQHEENLEAEIERLAHAVDPKEPLIGYRRGPVQVTLTGNWSLVIPGEFAEEWEENGETWSAWYGGRTIWFTSWSVKGENDDSVSPRDILDSRPWPEGGEIFEHSEGELFGRAVLLAYEEEGQPMWNFKGYTAIEDNFALCNIYLQNRDDLAWALETWKSVRNDQGEPS